MLSIIRWCVMQTIWFTIFNVKITARAYIIKIWLCLLYFLNYWSICKQTWFDSTALEARVSCGKKLLLHSRSRSQWRFKMLANVCLDDIFYKPQNIFSSNLVCLCTTISQCHAEKLICYLQCSPDVILCGWPGSKHQLSTMSRSQWGLI